MPTNPKPSAFSRYNDPVWRNVFTIPLADDFFILLQDRLNVCIENVLFEGKSNFTSFINAIDRKATSRPLNYKRTESPEFIYAGIDKQIAQLKLNFPKNSHTNLDDAWNILRKTIISFDRSQVSSNFYRRIQEGSYSLKDTCKINTLKDYFENPAKDYKEQQLAEHEIIHNYFNIKEDVFISIPLIGFGELDGIVHIVFEKSLLDDHVLNEEDDGTLYFPKRLIWSLIRSFIVEYDGIFLDWDQTGDNLQKVSAIYEFVRKTIYVSDEYFGRSSELGKAEIFPELKLQDYYRKHAEYFKKRFELGEGVPGKIYQAYITNAVTAILIDSYAHNVSAHALSTLSWWFYRRANLMRDEELDWMAMLEYLEQDPLIDKSMLKVFGQAIEGRAEKRIEKSPLEERQGLKQQGVQMEKDARAIRQEDGKNIIRYPGSLAREITRLLRFLTEKGAYWSGVTRDVNVGGKVSSLYSILWYDFINNPFYLGTIAKTEDIMNVKLRIVLYENEPKAKREGSTEYHLKRFKPENNGIFAEVDLANPRTSLDTPKGRTPHDQTLSVFVKKGEKFEYFREKLKGIKVFFPGGVVGRHAFFTMIENEIRNVKHYNHKELKKLQKEGLTVAIGIELCSLHNSTDHEIYRITVWLDTPTRLQNKDEEHLIKKKWDSLGGVIFDEKTYAPLLGGTYQDKVCAGFLLNGNFSNVQSGDRDQERDKSKDTGRDTQYYPWVRPACSSLEEEPSTLDEGCKAHKDYKISYNNPLETVEKTVFDPQLDEEETVDVIAPIVSDELPKVGYLKKIFYVWRGQFLMKWSPKPREKEASAKDSWDNPSRFKIVNLVPNADTDAGDQRSPLHEIRRVHGVVRVVHGEIKGKDEMERYAEAYKKWLHSLLGGGPLHALAIMQEGEQWEYAMALKASNGKLEFVKETIEPGKKFSVPIIDVLNTEDEEQIEKWELMIAHKENAPSLTDELCIRYRSHGIYKSLFLPPDAPTDSVDDPVMMELFEALATKVCIFDNRVHHRLRLDKDKNPEYKDFIRDKLSLAVFKENTPNPGSGRDAWLNGLNNKDQEFLKNCHFLVMHLSFIESILPVAIPDMKAVDRSNVGLFIEKYILPLVGKRDNFFFVVTTGRGRNQWWTSLDEDEYREYSKFTIFRAIESLLTAIENSVSMKDDVELKYRIVKILYGS